MEHSRVAFDLLRSNQLYAHTKKCEFMMEEFIFLGYMVEKDGIKVDKEKVESESYLGVTNLKNVG